MLLKFILRLLLSFLVLLFNFSCNNPFDNSGGQVSNEEDMALYGRKVYQSQCVICHGENGKAKLAQSPDISLTKLNETEIGDLVYHGRKTMPTFANKLGEPEITAVAKYVASLKDAH